MDTGRLDTSAGYISVPRSLPPICRAAEICLWTAAPAAHRRSLVGTALAQQVSQGFTGDKMILDDFEIYDTIMFLRAKKIFRGASSPW